MKEGKVRNKTLRLSNKAHAQLLKYTDLERAVKAGERVHIVQDLDFCAPSECEECPLGKLNPDDSNHHCYRVAEEVAGRAVLKHIDVADDVISWYTDDNQSRRYVKRLHDWLLSFKDVKR